MVGSIKISGNICGHHQRNHLQDFCGGERRLSLRHFTNKPLNDTFQIHFPRRSRIFKCCCFRLLDRRREIGGSERLGFRNTHMLSVSNVWSGSISLPMSGAQPMCRITQAVILNRGDQAVYHKCMSTKDEYKSFDALSLSFGLLSRIMYYFCRKCWKNTCCRPPFSQHVVPEIRAWQSTFSLQFKCPPQSTLHSPRTFIKGCCKTGSWMVQTSRRDNIKRIEDSDSTFLLSKMVSLMDTGSQPPFLELPLNVPYRVYNCFHPLLNHP